MSFFDRVAGMFGSEDKPARSQKLDEWLEETLKRELKVDSIERDDGNGGTRHVQDYGRNDGGPILPNIVTTATFLDWLSRQECSYPNLTRSSS